MWNVMIMIILIAPSGMVGEIRVFRLGKAIFQGDENILI